MKQAIDRNTTDATPPSAAHSIGAVWEGLRRGDHESMQRVWERIAAVCPAILRRARIPGAEQGDLLQETFLSTHAFARRHVVQPLHLDAFLQWRARSVIKSHWRAKERRRGVKPLSAQIQAGPGHSVEASVVGEELRALIEESVERWQPHVRRIWELRYGVMMSIREIASQLSMNAGTVATILFRARVRLNEDLQSVGFASRCA